MLDNILKFISPVSCRLIACTVVVILVLIIFKSKSFKCMLRSRGPWGVPILGYYPFLPKTNHHVHLHKLSRKYGDVYLFSLFGKFYLHLSSFKSVREVFINKSDCFCERAQDYSILTDTFKDGILALNGEEWRVWRKFLAQSMKEIGLGTKEQLKHPIQDAISATLEAIQINGSHCVNITALLLIQCSEVIRRLMLGEAVTSDTAQEINDVFRSLSAPFANFECFLSGRIARYISAYKIEGVKEMKAAKEQLDCIFKNLIGDHEKNLDMKDPKDIIDLYLREKYLRKEKGDHQVKYFTDQAFIDILIQIYGDGSFTIGATAAYFIYELARQENIQESMFTEISENIGVDILPTYEDRMKLPYTNSVIKELMRRFDVFPLQPSLQCIEDTTVAGVFVPKGTIAIINTHAVNNDESVYKDPEQFNPERFLLAENKENSKENTPLFFGLGKRSCLGETLVSTEVFLFVTAIIQQFKIKISGSNVKNDTHDTSEKVDADALQDEYFISAKLRKS